MICLCHIYNSRNRNRDLAVLTADKTCSVIKYRHDHIRDIQIIQADCDRYNVHDGIHCSNLMKMYLFYRNSVGFGLCLCKNLKYLKSCLFCSGCDRRALDDLPDFLHSAVFVSVFMDM